LLALPRPGDAVNRHEKRGSGPSDNQRFPIIFLYHGRQDGRPSTGIDPEGAADDDRVHFKRFRLPAACPVPGGGGFSAAPGRLKEAGIDDEKVVRELADRRHGGGV
jgi:hypothetical protein